MIKNSGAKSTTHSEIKITITFQQAKTAGGNNEPIDLDFPIPRNPLSTTLRILTGGSRPMNYCVHTFIDCYDCSRHHPSDFECCDEQEKRAAYEFTRRKQQ
jgi:hypothetical protein